jgi:hypothetical protein
MWRMWLAMPKRMHAFRLTWARTSRDFAPKEALRGLRLFQ